MKLTVETSERVEVVDVTRDVKSAVSESGVEKGVCTVFVPHTTAGITVNENESRLVKDVEDLLEEIVPENAGYGHDTVDSNADAHLRSVLLGSDVSIPVENGSLALGTWQSVLFFEGDGPRKRKVFVEVTASK